MAPQLLVETLSLGLALLQPLFQAGNLGHQLVGGLALALGDADLLAERLAPGLYRLALRNGSATALVDVQNTGRRGREATALQAFVEGFGRVADETYVVHG